MNQFLSKRFRADSKFSEYSLDHVALMTKQPAWFVCTMAVICAHATTLKGSLAYRAFVALVLLEGLDHGRSKAGSPFARYSVAGVKEGLIVLAFGISGLRKGLCFGGFSISGFCGSRRGVGISRLALCDRLWAADVFTLFSKVPLVVFLSIGANFCKVFLPLFGRAIRLPSLAPFHVNVPS